MVRTVFHLISILLSQARVIQYPGPAQFSQLCGKWPFTLTVAGPRQGAPMSLGRFCPEKRLHPDLGFRCPAALRPSKCTCCTGAFPRPQTGLRPGAEPQEAHLEECRVGGPRAGPLELCLIQPFPVSLFCTPLSCRRLPLPGDVLCRGLCGMGHRWPFSEPRAY